jgi:hypothetical protein
MLGATTLISTAVVAQTIQSTLLDPELPDDYSRGRNISVMERDRPEYQPLGIQQGQFTLFPSVEGGFGYSSNVFATQSHETGDGYFILNPTLTVQSNFATNALNFSAGGLLREYFSQASENENGWFVTADGRLDIDQYDNFAAGLVARHVYEERDSGGYPTGAAAPVPVTLTGIYTRLVHETGRIRAYGAFDATDFNYTSVPLIGGGTLTQADRDRYVLRFTGRGEYALTPESAVFAQYTYTDSHYLNDVSLGIPDRSSNESKFLTGATFDLTALVRGSIGVGYLRRDYHSPYRSLDGLTLAVKVEYFPTQIDTVTFAARRLIQDSIIGQSGGYFNNGVDLREDHELLRNLLLHAAIDYEDDKFDSVAREDKIAIFEAGAKYLVSQIVDLQGTMNYTSRTSDVGTAIAPGPKFDEFRFMFTVGAHL